MAGEAASCARSAILALLVRYCLKRRFVRSAAFVWQRTRERELSLFQRNRIGCNDNRFSATGEQRLLRALCTLVFCIAQRPVGWLAHMLEGGARLWRRAFMRQCSSAAIRRRDNMATGRCDRSAFNESRVRFRSRARCGVRQYALRCVFARGTSRMQNRLLCCRRLCGAGSTTT